MAKRERKGSPRKRPRKSPKRQPARGGAGRKSNNQRFDESPWLQLKRETEDRGGGRRQDLIKALGDAFSVQVVTFFTTFAHPSGSMSNADVEMIENLLSAEHGKGGILLVINCPGGDGLAAERMVNVCRSYSGDNFETLVPHMAKSAATMVCFGSNKIHLSKTGELGPVDPQVYYFDDADKPRGISAEEYLRSYDKLMKEAQSPESVSKKFFHAAAA